MTVCFSWTRRFLFVFLKDISSERIKSDDLFLENALQNSTNFLNKAIDLQQDCDNLRQKDQI